MTVAELAEYAKDRMDWDITIRKHDRWQLSCHTTVPVEKAYRGLDWTQGQIVLEPKVELVTSAEEIDKSLAEMVENYSKRLTDHLSIAAQIARLIQEIPDEKLRDKIHTLLKEM